MRVSLAEDSTLLRVGLARLLDDEGHPVMADLGDSEALSTAEALRRRAVHRTPEVWVTC